MKIKFVFITGIRIAGEGSVNFITNGWYKTGCSRAFRGWIAKIVVLKFSCGRCNTGRSKEKLVYFLPTYTDRRWMQRENSCRVQNSFGEGAISNDDWTFILKKIGKPNWHARCHSASFFRQRTRALPRINIRGFLLPLLRLGGENRIRELWIIAPGRTIKWCSNSTIRPITI